MANFIEKRPPSKPTYVVELSQDEWDVIGGLVNDLSDNRGVVMDYTIDEYRVIPTARGMEILAGMRTLFSGYQDADYDYDDYWQNEND